MTAQMRSRGTGAALALAAAALFGISAPLAKLLLKGVEPVMLAGLLYLGSGLGLLAFRLPGVSRRLGTGGEAPLRKADLGWLLGAILSGGIAAPILLMVSLRHMPAATASLLLNFEGVATVVLAGLLFREALGRRLWLAIALVTVASVLLSWDPAARVRLSVGALGILGACALWGLDNNLTRNIAGKDALAIAVAKGLVAGAFSFLLSLVLGARLPGFRFLLWGLLLGMFSYGISLLLFVRALRELGAARTSAFFGSAPFAGAVLSLFLFAPAVGIPFLAALPLMVLGAFLLLRERHSHRHAHARLEHEHRHRHADGHHNHEHPELPAEATLEHAHRHAHDPVEHGHPHTPDLHHRHGHE